jgi:hypothetical protein
VNETLLKSGREVLRDRFNWTERMSSFKTGAGRSGTTRFNCLPPRGLAAEGQIFPLFMENGL